MCGPVSFIVWGTKVRTRSRGFRADFCRGCLRLAKFQVKAIEEAKHVYYINGAYHEVQRYAECSVCGARYELAIRASLLTNTSRPVAIEELVKMNPELSLERLHKISKSLGQEFTTEERELRAMAAFCENTSKSFKVVEKNLGGWVGLFLIVFLILVGITFANAGVNIGIAVSVVLFVLLLAIRHSLIQRNVARIVRPRLQNLLDSPMLEWSRLKTAFEARELKSPRLWRHLRKGVYDEFRHEGAPMHDGVPSASIGIDEYLAAEPLEDAKTISGHAESSQTASATRSEGRPEKTAKNNFEIVHCRQCHIRVVPKGDGSCPSCQAGIA